jgi:hypothetical protein
VAAIPISGLHSVWDVCATVLLLAAIVHWRDVASPKPWAWLSCAALAGLSLSALANGQHVASMIGAVVSVGSMVGTLIFIQRLYRRDSRHGLLAAACLAIGVSLHGVLVQTSIGSINPWKYGAGFGVAIVLLAWAAATRKVSLELSILAVLVIISLATGSRGLTGTLVITSVLVILRGVARQRSVPVRIAAALLLVAGTVTVTSALGSFLVNSGLANSARDRFLQQVAINSNPILAGRLEPPISISAVMAHPVIGAGTNPEPTPEIVSRALHIADVLGYTNPDALVEWWTQGDQIYVHSLVMEYWVVGGVLAALPFVVAFGVLVVGLVRSLFARKAVPALAIFLAAQSLSDILFAPETWGSAALVGLSVGMVYATLFAPREATESWSSEVEEPTHPRAQFGIAQGLSH